MKFRHLIITISIILLIVTNNLQISAQVKSNDKPKNIILISANGLGMTQLTAAMINKGNDLNIFRIKNIGFIKTHSVNELLPDPGAASTAIACGVKTYKGAVGVDKDKNPVKSILEIAKEKNKRTGIITTSTIVSACPAVFFSHVTSYSKFEQIALDLFNSELDVFISKGQEYFKRRKDKRDLVFEFQQKGYKIIDKYKKLNKKFKTKIAGLIATSNLKNNREGQENYLSLAWQNALRVLMRNTNGYFVIINDAHIDIAAQAHNLKMLSSEILELDKLVGEILDFIVPDKETLVVLISGYETGGMIISDGNIQEKKVNVKWSSKSHTGTLTPVFAIGPGSEQFTGIYDNTEIFQKLKDLID